MGTNKNIKFPGIKGRRKERHDAHVHEESSSRSEVDAQNIKQLKEIMKGISKSNTRTNNEIAEQGFLPFFELFSHPKESDKQEEKKDEKKEENKESKFVKQSVVDKVVKQGLNKTKGKGVKEETLYEDVKKRLQQKKSRRVISKVVYVFLLVIVSVVSFHMGKRSESENYLRVL